MLPEDKTGHAPYDSESTQRGSDYVNGCAWSDTHDDRWHIRPIDIGLALSPLIERLRHYDQRRVALEAEGGTSSDLDAIVKLLTEEITMSSRAREYTVKLTDPGGLAAMVSDVTRGESRLQVRRLQSGMPGYYVCRVRSDFWSAYRLVVEDLYCSPGYPVVDDRFTTLMVAGREMYHLRLSQFRDTVIELAGHPSPNPDADQLLYDLGRYVFQAMWHEDQRPGMLAATHLDLPQFRQAIELLYLCLSGDLCALRSAVDDAMLRFFHAGYEQPAVSEFLMKIGQLEGSDLNDLPQSARRLYTTLTRSFGRFLATTVTWGQMRETVPLFKVIFSNLSRLHVVGEPLRRSEVVRRAAAELEHVAAGVISQISK